MPPKTKKKKKNAVEVFKTKLDDVVDKALKAAYAAEDAAHEAFGAASELDAIAYELGVELDALQNSLGQLGVTLPATEEL